MTANPEARRRLKNEHARIYRCSLALQHQPNMEFPKLCRQKKQFRAYTSGRFYDHSKSLDIVLHPDQRWRQMVLHPGIEGSNLLEISTSYNHCSASVAALNGRVRNPNFIEKFSCLDVT